MRKGFFIVAKAIDFIDYDNSMWKEDAFLFVGVTYSNENLLNMTRYVLIIIRAFEFALGWFS